MSTCLSCVTRITVALAIDADTLVVAVVSAVGLLGSSAVTATEAGVALALGALADAVAGAVAGAALVFAAVSTAVIG